MYRDDIVDVLLNSIMIICAIIFLVSFSLDPEGFFDRIIYFFTGTSIK